MRKTKIVYCSECKKQGRDPKMLCLVEDVEGSFRVWCKQCRKEIRVTVTNGEILTRAEQ